VGTFLTVAGVLVQLLGAVVAIRGLIKTHDAYAEKSIRTIATKRAAVLRRSLIKAIRKLLRRPHAEVVITGTGGGSFQMGAAIAAVAWVSLPTDTAEAIKELDRRLQETWTRVNGLDQRIAQVAAEDREALDKLRRDLEQAGYEANVLIRHAALEGLAGEAVGLFLVIVGGLMQAAGALA
jgi:hypothetical protein